MDQFPSPLRRRRLSRAGPRPSAGGLEEVSPTKGQSVTRRKGKRGHLPKALTLPWKQIQVFLKLFLVYFWRELGIQNQILPPTGRHPAREPRIHSSHECLGRPGAVLPT